MRKRKSFSADSLCSRPDAHSTLYMKYVRVFFDGQDIDTVSVLSSLINKSLVKRWDSAAKPDFQMLPTIREYALEKLKKNGEYPKISERFGQYVLDVAERNEREFYGPNQERAFELLNCE